MGYFKIYLFSHFIWETIRIHKIYHYQKIVLTKNLIYPITSNNPSGMILSLTWYKYY